MSLLHALVAHDSTILAEYPPNQDTFASEIKDFLSELRPSDQKSSQPLGSHTLHYSFHNHFAYLVISESQQPNDSILASVFLDELQQRFSESHPSQDLEAVGYCLQGSFGPMIQEIMIKYNANPPPDKVLQVRLELEETVATMKRHIAEITGSCKGHSIEDLIPKSDPLREQAKMFYLEPARRRRRRNRNILVGSGILGMIVVCGTILWSKWRK